MVKNLDKEYTSVNTIYEQQKEYRKTPEGKLALKRANEKQLTEKRCPLYNCGQCGDNEFEVLNVYDGDNTYAIIADTVEKKCWS